jgi:hypothetical protein
MIKSLVAIYHSRVDYPGYVPPNAAQKGFSSSDSESKQRGLHLYEPEEVPISPNGEVEDEAIIRSHLPDKAEAKAVK